MTSTVDAQQKVTTVVPLSSGSGLTSLTPWTEHINGGGFNLTGAGNISGANITSSGTITGNGASVTNIWVKQHYTGSCTPTALTGGATQWAQPNGAGALASTVDQRIQAAPYGGYLTNFTFWSTNVPTFATSNIVLCIQTNTLAAGASAIGTLVDSPLLLTLAGSFNNAATNTTTQSAILPSSRFNYFTIRIVSSAGLAAREYFWSFEHWYQTTAP